MNKEYEEYIDELRLHGTRELAEEIYKLESNWKALKEWLENISKQFVRKMTGNYDVNLYDVLNKINELEGDK